MQVNVLREDSIRSSAAPAALCFMCFNSYRGELPETG